MALDPGTRLGPYEITAPLGVGGMGEVYRAIDTNLKRQVAIKVLPASVASDPERLARFQREAEVLAALNHPNIAHIHGLEKSAGTIALVMELVEGPTLADRIANGAIPIDEVLPFAKQIADALEAAHEQGIVHRDLKPANIKVRPDGTVKVLDFGLAKAMDSSGAPSNVSMSPTITSPAMTQAGIILGTAAYMSPEQAVGKPVDKRTDLWSFGVVLLEMLIGRQVFHGETVSHVLASVLKDEPDWVALPAQTPTSIRRLLRRCLEKDRKRRLADAADARLEIEDVLSGPVETVQRARTRRSEAIAWGVAALTLVGAGLAVWQGRRPVATAPLVASQFVVPAPEHLVYSSVPAISPDGRTIAFVATGSDGRSRLWVRRLDVLAARAVVGTDSALAPFWSPDGRNIGFFVRGELKKVDIDGGAPQVVAATSGSTRNVSGSWSRDNVILFSAGSEGLRSVSATGGDVSSVATGGSYPFFLPDGNHFLLSRSRGGPQSGIFLGTLGSPDSKFLVAADSAGVYADPGFLLFSRGEVLMAQPFDPVSLTLTGSAVRLLDGAQVRFGGNRQAVSAAVNHTLLYGWRSLADTRLEWVDRHGTRGSFATDPGEYGDVALSPDGSRVAFDRVPDGGSTPDVWLLDLTRHVTSRFTFGPSTNNVPVWSPESRTLAFASGSGGALDIAQRPANMSGPQQTLLKLNVPPIMYPSDWSSDGKFLTYYRTDRETNLDLWVLALGDGGQATPLLHSKFNESQGQFSPDGKWIAYVSDESGSPQVYVQSFPTLTGKWQVSSSGGSQPRWRHDGKELFYLAPDRKLMAVTVRTGQTFDSESAQVLFETILPFEAQRQSYSVSTDGQRFLLNAPVESDSSPFTIVLNWTGLLKK